MNKAINYKRITGQQLVMGILIAVIVAGLMALTGMQN